MRRLRNLLCLASLLCLGIALHAQTTVTTSGGTTAVVPVYTGSSTLGNSPISISGTNVGIGTTAPGTKLEINQGSIALSSGTSTATGGFSSFSFNTVGTNTTNGYSAIQGFYAGVGYTTPVVLQNQGGNVGIGMTTPPKPLDVRDGNDDLVIYNDGDNRMAIQSYIDGHWNDRGSYVPSETRLLLQPDAGNVGIGTAEPGEKLEVAGNIRMTPGTGSHITFADSTQQSTAWTGVLSGGDYAESVDVSGDRTKYEPGDVLVIDPNTEGNFLKSSVPYATTVTGIYSTKPGVTGRRQHTSSEHMKEEVPMAMTGIVPTKVSAENGPIKPGDLLVTSSKPGYAMKGTDRSQMLGAVIGKAIGHLNAGTGIIEAVVTLQ